MRGSASRQQSPAEKIAAAQRLLGAEVARLQSGEDWAAYLRQQARLHTYSAANVVLIAAQHRLAYDEGRVSDPEPSMVAGFRTWKALGRSVERGQRGYAIFAPVTSAIRTPSETPHTGRLEPGAEAPSAEGMAVQRVLRGFRLAYVWDHSQTTGATLAEPPRPRLLSGEAPAGLEARVADLVADRGFSLELRAEPALLGEANGRTDFGTTRVSVRAGLDEAARVKTLLHEAAHVLLHAGGPGVDLPRATKELEAESVAFVVGAAHGMDSGDYSFAYMAGWAGADGAKKVAATQARVAEAASVLIAASTAPRLLGGRPPGLDAALAVTRHVPVGAASSSADPAPATVVL